LSEQLVHQLRILPAARRSHHLAERNPACRFAASVLFDLFWVLRHYLIDNPL
jgi:hypothetical protein